MSILMYIFVVLINNIMQSKEILTAPIADAITPSGVVDKPSACGALILTDMKMIEDLGFLSPTKNNKYGRRYGMYECPFCGKHFSCMTSHIKNGHTKSCGCVSHKMTAEKRITHGLSSHPLYSIWRCMVNRCTNPSHKSYKDYGMRGITICDEWVSDAQFFYQWAIASGYQAGLVLDRENNDGNYEPSNCRWTTTNISAENKRLLMIRNSSGFRGVTFLKRKNYKKPWRSVIQWNGIAYKLGCYTTAIKAAKAYDNFVITHKTNHPLNNV